eukprot:TRINITY_DN54926_c0_g1_i1.p1 TRINITY_DN54926_c0_g1~~TRINITY_DN54926_c0_g1_i1.p1  ORF type:complete len:168 (-),score=31.72 TRINITY_DN54926_c0_g1_i1:8-511(-)
MPSWLLCAIALQATRATRIEHLTQGHDCPSAPSTPSSSLLKEPKWRGGMFEERDVQISSDCIMELTHLETPWWQHIGAPVGGYQNMQHRTQEKRLVVSSQKVDLAQCQLSLKTYKNVNVEPPAEQDLVFVVKSKFGVVSFKPKSTAEWHQWHQWFQEVCRSEEVQSA